VLAPISPNFPQLARQAANTRHYYTHFDKDMAPKAAQGEALFRLNQVLAIAVQASILLHCGFSVERIAVLMNAFPPHQELVMRTRAGDTPDGGTEANSVRTAG
jgi:Apea-like HEPN